jgi:hypothetical protein
MSAVSDKGGKCRGIETIDAEGVMSLYSDFSRSRSGILGRRYTASGGAPTLLFALPFR